MIRAANDPRRAVLLELAAAEVLADLADQELEAAAVDGGDLEHAAELVGRIRQARGRLELLARASSS